MRNTSLTFSAHDWRLTDRFAGFTLIDLSGEWLRGDWFTVTLAILGLRVTLTRWLAGEREEVGAWLAGVESRAQEMGREHGA